MGREPLTNRGRRTRARIVAVAADLIGDRGVRATGLDDIITSAGVSKSQLYHYFASKDDLVFAVVTRQTERVLEAQMPRLEHLDNWEAIASWFDWIVAVQERRQCVGGCPIGSLANELADRDEAVRSELAASFERWQRYLEHGLDRMRARGELVPETDPEALALAAMASIQGGLLLTRTQRSPRPIRVALDAALCHLRLYAGHA